MLRFILANYFLIVYEWHSYDKCHTMQLKRAVRDGVRCDRKTISYSLFSDTNTIRIRIAPGVSF